MDLTKHVDRAVSVENDLDVVTTSDDAILLQSGMTLAEAFDALARPLLMQVLQYAKDADYSDDPENLHLLRVGLRRLRVLWWAFAPVISRDSRRADEAEFKRLADAAGQTRNWDVLGDILFSKKPVRHIAQSLKVAVEQRREEALASSKETLRQAQLDETLRAILATTRLEIASADDNSIGRLATRRIKVARKNLKKRIKSVSDRKHAYYEHIHRVRIAGKKLRYLLEFFAPISTDTHDKALKRLGRFQAKLGRLNDLVVSQAILGDVKQAGVKKKTVKKVRRFMSKQKEKRVRSARTMLNAM